IEISEVDSQGPGNLVFIEIESDTVKEVVTAFGERQIPAEAVAKRAAREAKQYLESDVPVGLHLADQLLIPLAMAGGGAYRTLAPTAHTKTNIEVVRRFLDVGIRMQKERENAYRIEID
ncbi:MAG: RNA 3'-terminal phosphate cyclase, partial [Candidatus Omnitrophica bacterium]|nr:RNA 3'-terminal phosphate cyclase [Candidatus Omnitrophota bacterium]